MCLCTLTNTAYKTSKPLICYKVVVINRTVSAFESIHKYHIYRINEKYYERRFRSKINSHSVLGNIVNYGFHSYVSYTGARRMIKEYKTRYNNNGLIGYYPDIDNAEFVILKCEIPANSLYFFGNSGWSSNGEYCSNKIKVLAWKREYGKWHDTFNLK